MATQLAPPEQRQGPPDGQDPRDFYPYLSTRTYLDTAATGLTAPGAGAAAAAVYDLLLSRGFDARPEWLAIRDRVASRLAGLLNVAPDAIEFASSSSDALIRAIQATPIRPGDKVVLATDEFPTLDVVMRHLAVSGAEIVAVPVAQEEARTDALCEAAPGARIVAASHVHWETGTRIDLARLSAACRATGAWLVVDGVHAVGAVPVDAALADLYVTSFFKWTLAGFGLGASVVSPVFRAALEPRQRGYANPAPSRALQHSHLNYPGLAALDAALVHLEGVGWQRIFDRVGTLRRDLVTKLGAAGVAVTTPESGAGIVSIPVPDPEATVRRLAERGISVSARGRAVRVAPHFYNNEGDIAAFCAALNETEDACPR